MDPTTARLLDDLKDLLAQKVITLGEWRAETAAVHSRALAANQAPPPPPPAAQAAPAQPAQAAPAAPGTGKHARKNAKKRAAKKARKAAATASTLAEPQAVSAAPQPAATEPAATEPAATEPAGFYHAEFTVRLFETTGGRKRPAGSYTLRGWAQLDAELATATKGIQDASPVEMGIETWPVAAAFGWGELHNNWGSATGELTISTFEPAEDGSHEPGTWDAKNVKLTRRGRVQPTLGSPAGRFVKAGGDIARPEFYRPDSCMLSLFLETFADRLKTHRDDLTLEGLYRMATGEELVEGQPAGVSLREAEKWLDRWRLAGRAINSRGELIWRYDPLSASKKIAGGAVWRLLVHDEHVWLCDRETKEFDRGVTAKDARKACDSIPTAADISAQLSSRWRRPLKPTGIPPTFVDSVADVLALDQEVTAVVTNGSPEALFVGLWEAGHQPGSVRLNKGAVDSFTVRVGAEGKQAVRVGPAIESAAAAEQVLAQALTSRSQVVFEEHLARARAAFQPIDGLSTYSQSLATAFRSYTRGPRVGLLSCDVAKDAPCVEFDVSRAYTSFLAEIKQVPVFSSFDEVRPYDGSEVEPHAFYLVRVPVLDGLLFPQRCDFVPGATVSYARGCGIALELLGVARPCRLVNTNGEAVLRALYEDEELPDRARKDVANICYGLANKGRNRKQVAACYLDGAEAKAHGGYIKQLGPGFIAVKQGEKALTEGYLPVGRLVLDAMRRRLHATVSALGGDAVGVKTDAVFVRAEHGERAAKALRSAGFKFAAGLNGWDVVGALKQLPKALPEMSAVQLSGSPEELVRPVPVPVCERIFLQDEEATMHGDWSEVDALMPTRDEAPPPPAAVPDVPEKNTITDEDLADLLGFDFEAPTTVFEPWTPPPLPVPVMLRDFVTIEEWNSGKYDAKDGDEDTEAPVPSLADIATAVGATKRQRRTAIALEAWVPGAGKTYLIKVWLVRTGQKETGLIVCPWNALVTQLVKEGFRAITLHELVGRLAVETEDGRDYKKAYNLDGVTHIHFEEAYLYPVHQVGWMADFMAKHPDLSYSMAGDPGQLAPVRQDLCVDSDAWYEQAFATMFPRRICLRVSKRVTDPADREKMMRLCDELRAEALPVPDILYNAGLPVIKFEDLTEADAHFPHLAATRSTMARVDHWAHALIGETLADEYAVGQELLGVDGVRCRGGRIASNESYTVLEVDDKGLTLTAPDGSQRTVTLAAAKRYLKRPYSRTGHSTQGLSLGDRIFIHDWRSAMATHRWMRTAVSRCGTLDIILVDGSEGLRSNWRVNQARIDAHRAADLAKGFSWDPEDYVSSEWVAQTLRRQRYSCWACADPLDLDWSIDRIANELPHLRGNCALSCRSCQSASAHRE